MDFESYREEVTKELLDKLNCDNIENIKHCYHKLALQYRNDLREINESYSLLRDRDKLKQFVQDKWDILQKHIINDSKVSIILKQLGHQIKSKEENYQLFQNIIGEITILYRKPFDINHLKHLEHIEGFYKLYNTIDSIKSNIDINYIPLNNFVESYNTIKTLDYIREILYNKDIKQYNIQEFYDFINKYINT